MSDRDRMLREAAQLRRAKRTLEAIAAYQRLLAHYPNEPDSWYNLGLLLRQARRPVDALDAYQQALRRKVSSPEEIHLNRAVIYSDDLAHHEEALRELNAALKLAPHYLPAWLNLGNLAEDQGDREGAASAYRRALSLDPGNSLAWSRLAQCTPRGKSGELVATIQGLLSDTKLSLDARANLGFGLGKVLDDVGRYAEAFDAYSDANKASRVLAQSQGHHYRRDEVEAWVDRIIRAPVPAAGSPASEAIVNPIFVFGMFRSGSSLVEAILSNHPDVTSGGELDIFPKLVRELLFPYPDSVAGAATKTLTQLAVCYCNELQLRFPNARRVVDKRPDNFLYVGLLSSMFTHMPLIHTRRNPLDNCLSIFFLHLDASMPYATDLGDITHWYGQYRRLIRHWSELLGTRMHTLDYDALVVDPEPLIARLLKFCGLEWSDACLRFHEGTSSVRTASVWQVREPIYQRSSGRWRNYEAQLATLVERLTAWD